jgi:hypothetical protein
MQIASRAASKEEVSPPSTNIDLLITLSSSILAIVLFIISLPAYLVDRRTRFLFVMAAFFLFAIKGVLIALTDLNNMGLIVDPYVGIVGPFLSILTPLSRLLDFGVLIFFFVGMLKK